MLLRVCMAITWALVACSEKEQAPEHEKMAKVHSDTLAQIETFFEKYFSKLKTGEFDSEYLTYLDIPFSSDSAFIKNIQKNDSNVFIEQIQYQSYVIDSVLISSEINSLLCFVSLKYKLHPRFLDHYSDDWREDSSHSVLPVRFDSVGRVKFGRPLR